MPEYFLFGIIVSFYIVAKHFRATSLIHAEVSRVLVLIFFLRLAFLFLTLDVTRFLKLPLISLELCILWGS